MNTRPWTARLRHRVVYGRAVPVLLGIGAAGVAGVVLIRQLGAFVP